MTFKISDKIISEIYSKESTAAVRTARTHVKSGRALPMTLGVLAIFSLVFGVWKFRANLVNPMTAKFAAKSSFNQLPLTQKPLSDATSQIDTDLDGLTDYDELNIYLTSPYLPDSDSDKFTDFQEIQAQSDPNCPYGKTCLAVLPAGDSPTLVTPLTSNNLPTILQTPTALRQVLRQNGFPQESLDALTDEEILAAYQQANFSAGPGVTVTGGSTLTPLEIRQLLLQQGVSQEQLDSLSDEELLKLAAETQNEIQ